MTRIERSCHFELGLAAGNQSEWLRRLAEPRTEIGNSKRNRHVSRYIPPRPLEGIDADLKQAEEEILRLLREVTE